MKIIYILIILLGICYAQTAEPDSLDTKPPIIRFDKIQHAAVSCLLTLSSQYILVNKSAVNEDKALTYSITSSAIIGLTKELNDVQTKKVPFSWSDLLANFVGIGIAVLIVTN